MEKHPKNIAHIALKDIRDLHYVRKYSDIFSDKIPVYFRVDLARAIIAYQTLKQSPDTYFVYSDFDVKPLNKSELFDQQTLRTLNKYKYVMAEKGSYKFRYENSFQMFAYEPLLAKSIKEILIKANVTRAQSYLEFLSLKWPMNEMIYKIFTQNVFHCYPLMHIYLCQLHEKGINLELPSECTSYEKKQRSNFQNNAIDLISYATESLVDKFPIPTKKISMPESQFATGKLNS